MSSLVLGFTVPALRQAWIAISLHATGRKRGKYRKGCAGEARGYQSGHQRVGCNDGAVTRLTDADSAIIRRLERRRNISR